MELMKSLTFYLFIFSSALLAGEKGLEKSPEKNEVKGGIVINESLQKLMDIDGVQPIYETCKKNVSPSLGENARSDKILQCLWTGVSANADLKKKVQTAYSDELKVDKTADPKTGRSPASTKSNLTGRSTSVATDYESDPAVLGLSKFYGEKLDEILDPDKALTKEENKKGMILTTNHRQFIDLYKSELGKTIINAFTSYCLDTDPETCTSANPACTLDDSESKRTEHRKKNIESLATANLAGDSDDSKKWRTCISSVPKSCMNAKSNSTGTQSETVKRSCLIMDYVESARKNIIAADDQKKFYDDLAVSNQYNIVSNSKEADSKKVSTDAILEMSSKDVEVALKEPLAQDKAEFESCFKDDVVVNVKACEKYLNTNKEANEMAIAELGMRQLAQEGALEEALNSSDSKVRDYLKEEGYSPEDIKNMTADKASIETVKNEIMERYKNQKSAIIAEMTAKINGKTSSTDGKIDVKTDVNKLKAIRNELASRSADLSNLVKFNNIVSSYLEVSKEGSKTNDRNTASLFGEVADMNAADKKNAELQLKNAKLKENKSSDGSSMTNLDVKTINNEFLNYSNQKKADEK